MEAGDSPDDLASLEWRIEPFGVVHFARLAALALDPMEMATPLALKSVESTPPHSPVLGSVLLLERHFERTTRSHLAALLAFLGRFGRLCAAHTSKECECLDRLVHLDLLLWLRLHHLGRLVGHANGLACSTC